VKRTLLSKRVMSAPDPKQTKVGLKSRSAAVSSANVVCELTLDLVEARQGRVRGCRRWSWVAASNTRKDETPATHFWLGPHLADGPLCVGEWQETLSLPHPSAGHPVMLIRAKDLLLESIATLGHPGVLRLPSVDLPARQAPQG